MNEWERRVLAIVQNHADLITAARSLGPDALIEYFGYGATIGGTGAVNGGPLLNGVTQQATITIQADALFVLQFVSCGVVLPATATNGGIHLATNALNINLQITDVGAGEILFSRAISAALVAGSPGAGSAGIPLILPIPRIVPSNTNIKIEATQNGLTALTNTEPVGCYVSLLGARVAQIGAVAA